MIKYLLHIHGDREDRYPAFEDLRDCILHDFPDVKLIFSPAEANGLTLVIGANLDPASLLRSENMPNFIIYNFEQVFKESAWMNELYVSLCRKCKLWDYSRQNILAWQRLFNIHQGVLVPFTYSPAMEFKKDPSLVQLYDVLFYGSMNQRRGMMLDSLTEHGIKIGYFLNASKEMRDTAIQQARIVLNYHYYESKVFEVLRVCHLAANEQFVISEASEDPWANAYYSDVCQLEDTKAFSRAVREALKLSDEELKHRGKLAKDALLRLPFFADNIKNALKAT